MYQNRSISKLSKTIRSDWAGQVGHENVKKEIWDMLNQSLTSSYHVSQTVSHFGLDLAFHGQINLGECGGCGFDFNDGTHKQ
jgi:hypothetical protein